MAGWLMGRQSPVRRCVLESRRLSANHPSPCNAAAHKAMAGAVQICIANMLPSVVCFRSLPACCLEVLHHKGCQVLKHAKSDKAWLEVGNLDSVLQKLAQREVVCGLAGSISSAFVLAYGCLGLLCLQPTTFFPLLFPYLSTLQKDRT